MSDPEPTPSSAPPDAPSGGDAIVVEGLEQRYGEVRALQGVSFRVPRGQICGYLGPNGAGKSTTIKAIAGILRPTAGRVLLAGHDVAEAPLDAKRALGYVPESGALYSLLSAREHLALVADLYELEPERAAEQVERLLALFELEPHADRRIDTLSKGQRQKVAIACALLHDPEVVLLDEPLDGLDANAARTLKDIVTGLAERGRAVLYCSHVLDVVERLCDRAIILDGGRIVADAPTAELLAAQRDGEAGATLEGVFHRLTRVEAGTDLAAAFLASVAPRGAAAAGGATGGGKKGKKGKRR